MPTADILKSLRIAPPLSKSTYVRWSYLVEQVLENLGVVALIRAPTKSETGKDPESSTKPLNKNDGNLRAALIQLVPEELFYLVHGKSSSREMWEALAKFYKPRCQDSVCNMLQDFWSFSMDDGVDVDTYAEELLRRQIRIASVDVTQAPSDVHMKSRLLSHFNSSCGGIYMGAITVLRNDTSISFADSVNSIRESHPTMNPHTNFASVSLADDAKPLKHCAYCKRTNHTRETCFLWLDTPDGTKWASKNPEKAAKARSLRERFGKKKRKNETTCDADLLEESLEDSAWVMEEYVLSATSPIKDSSVVLDTGASNHIFHDKSFFDSISPNISKSILTASGQTIPVSGVGSVRFRVFDLKGGSKSREIKMDNVWYVPSCTRNLVSGAQLVSKGLKLQSTNKGLSVLSRGNIVIATARPKWGLFYFNTANKESSTYLSPCSKDPVNALLSQDAKISATKLIHNRYAHVGAHLLENIDVAELDLPNIKADDYLNFSIDKSSVKCCNVCLSCKQVEKINRGPTPRSSDILEVIHSDTWGKCCVSGIYGSNYFVTFTDEASRESELRLLKSKKEVADSFYWYKDKKELQSGRKIKAMRFDGGSEFKAIKLEGIVPQISAPYTQHQNGVSERLNRSLITMTRCMLNHAGLPLRFWDAAVLTACYLRNRLPLLPDKKTPFEAMNGFPPKRSHLKVWGCICFVLIDTHDPRRFKLSPTSSKGIFVGYCESSTQYQVYIPSKYGRDKIVTSANVHFLEDSFWNWERTSSSSDGVLDIRQNDDNTSLEYVDDSDPDTTSGSDLDLNSSLSLIDTQISRSNSPPIRLLSNSPPDQTSPAIEQNNTDIDFANGPVPSQDTIDSSRHTAVDTLETPPLRRSSRVRKPIEPRSAWQPRSSALYVGGDIPIPQTYKDAINGPNSLQWQTAIEEELKSLQEKNVFSPVTHVPHERKPIGSRWVFTIKSDGRFKARLVAQGFSQIYGVDYFNTYSPTLRADSLRIILAVATFFDWEIDQVDVKTAYLEGDLNEAIFMKAPDGLTGTKVVRIDKALYGLKQSGKAWYDKLDARLQSLNFRRSDSDQCVYINPQNQMVIGVYVDDLVICGNTPKNVQNLKDQLSSSFPIKDLGLIDTVIGWKITRDRSNRSLTISQSDYINDKIRSFGLSDAKPYNSPQNGYDGILPAAEGEQLADESAYASAVGSLGYAASGTRPDIAFATSQLGRFNSSPVKRHWDSVCRVLRYLKGTENYRIKYNFGPVSHNLPQEKMAILYSDSDFASDITTRHSVNGYLFMLGGGPVCWQSKKQKSVATSSTEAEYIALCDASKQAVWASRLFKELGVFEKLVGNSGMKVLSDNQSALAIANGTNSSKTKHIDIAYHFTRECILNKTITVDYISTDKMLADILTKPLSPRKAMLLCQKIFNLPDDANS